MKCESKNYLHIYNTKLIEENTQFNKKIKTFEHLLCFTCSNFFLLIPSNMFSLEQKLFFRIHLPNAILFLKT